MLSSKEQANQVYILLGEIQSYMRRKHKKAVLDKIEILLVVNKETMELEGQNPRIVVTYDKFAKKIGQKYMAKGKWGFVLDVNA